MKNIFLKSMGAAVSVILVLALLAQVQVFTQDKDGENQRSEQLQTNSLERGYARDLEGSWTTEVTIRNCQTGAAITTFPAMITFMHGGTMHEFSTGSGLLRGPGHGVWSHESGRTFAYAFQFFRFNADGTYAGLTKARRQVALDRYGSAYTATATIEILNPAGALVGTACATETATRFE